ncbi:MAG: ScyD/ScyE family protein [Chloroflexi bacterium]|nr:ScyD/ScyE family protein [Chloroflexota bacterium]
MRSKLLFLLTTVLILALATAAFAQPGPPPPPELTGDVILEGLNGPQGVHVDADGNLWVIDSGIGGEDTVEIIDPITYEVVEAPFGNSSQLIRVTPGGEPEVIANLPAAIGGQDFLGGGRIVDLDGEIYITHGIWHLNLGEEVTIPYFSQVVRIGMDGEPTTVADLWAHELAENPDETTNFETHPYGIAAGPDGLLYVADAAANALLTVDPETGETATVAGFEGLPGIFPSQWREGALITDPVPTGVVVNEDGTALVSYLSGAPFVPGSAKVVQVSPEGEVSDYATGLTMLVDLKRGPDGNLYAVQHGLFTAEGPVFNSGAVIRILEDGTAEVVIDGLPFATSIAFDADGNGYVAINGAAIPEAGAVVYYEGLTEMEGQPLPAMGPQN